MLKWLKQRRAARAQAAVARQAIETRIAELTQERARIVASYDAAIGELQKLIAPKES